MSDLCFLSNGILQVNVSFQLNVFYKLFYEMLPLIKRLMIHTLECLSVDEPSYQEELYYTINVVLQVFLNAFVWS